MVHEMIKLKNDVQDIKEDEIVRAAERHPSVFASRHEFAAVYREEYEEFMDDVECIKHDFDRLWEAIKTDADDGEIIALANQLEFSQDNATCESIQAGAMVKKLKISMETWRSSKPKRKFKLEDYQEKKCVMCCRTQREADIFCSFLHDEGRKWRTGTPYKDQACWDLYGTKTCYHFNEGTYGNSDLALRENGCVILNFNNYDWSEYEGCNESRTCDKPKFEIEKYLGKYAMHCDTEEKSKVFLSYLRNHGRKWNDGEYYGERTYHEQYKTDTCYFFNEGCYADVKCTAPREIILEFDDYDWSEYEEDSEE